MRLLRDVGITLHEVCGVRRVNWGVGSATTSAVTTNINALRSPAGRISIIYFYGNANGTAVVHHLNPTELRILRTTIKAFPAVVPHLTGKARWVAMATPQLLVGSFVELRSWDHYIVYKSYDYFLQQLERLIRSVHDGQLGGEFMDIMANLISGQLTDAYQAAIDEAGLSPDEVTEAMKGQLDDFIQAEYEHVRDFYDAIVDARVDDTGVDPLLSRAGLWANRWRDVNSAAKLTIAAELGQNMVWTLGETEQHCETCQALNGLVAGALEWDTAGLRPQNAPNDLLECGGWRCDCSLTVTDKRRSPRALDTLLNIAVSRND